MNSHVVWLYGRHPAASLRSLPRYGRLSDPAAYLVLHLLRDAAAQ